MALVAWPDLLPAPLAGGYSYQPQASFIRTNMDSGLARQRRRFTRIPSTVSVAWVFTQEQLALFEGFVHYDISDGADWFSAKIANGQELQTVKARMTTAPKVDLIEPGIWHVSVQMETIDMPMATADQYAALRDFGEDVLHADVGSLHALVHVELPGGSLW
ncbi:hypothetical protein [Ralstonia thomasii]|jgi:hypothetical protein